MLTAPLKIGFAAACLVAVAIWIAVDQSSLRREDSVLYAPATPQAVLPPPMVAPGTIIPGRAETPQICPAVATTTPAEVAAKPDTAEAKPAPKPEEKPAAAPVQPKKVLIETLPGGQRVYTVVQGDTLYGISVKVYNTPRHYERIYDANQERIADPNTLQIGMKLVLPDHAAGIEAKDLKTTNP